jgi:hypothetical protein
MALIGEPQALERIKRAKELVGSERVQDEILPAAQLVRDVAIRLVNQGPGIKAKLAGGKVIRRLHLKELIFATKGRKSDRLMASLARAIAGDQGPSVIAGVDLKKAPHAHLVEFGHGGPHPAPAYPFLRRAVSACKARVAAIIEDALRRLLGEVAPATPPPIDSAREYFTGPRGGRYYQSDSGSKVYVPRQ